MRSLRNLIYPKFRIWKWSRKVMVETDGASYSVVFDRRVKMAPPPSDPIADYQNQTGAWFTVTDNAGRALYRRVFAPPLVSGIEVFGSTQPLYRLDPVAPGKVTLVFVFPDFAEVARLEVFISARDADGRLAPASSVAAFALKEPDRMGEKHGRE
jgi:hypothetical protein